MLFLFCFFFQFGSEKDNVPNAVNEQNNVNNLHNHIYENSHAKESSSETDENEDDVPPAVRNLYKFIS